jgi:hypothetical protein
MRPAMISCLATILLAQTTFAQTRPTPPRIGLTPPATATAPSPPQLGLPGTPATKPAVDRSAPDKTWAALCAAVKAGDLAAFRACCYNKNEISTLFMDAFSDTLVTTFQLAAAMAPLGADGQAMAKDLQSTYDDLVKTGQNRKAVINGDSAKWVQTVASEKLVAEQVMYFKKVGKEWLLDTEMSYNLNAADGRKAAEDFIAGSAPTLKALKSVIADIKAKRITTVAQVRARLSTAP